VIEDDEVLLLQIRDRLPVLVVDDDVDLNQVSRGPEDRSLRGLLKDDRRDGRKNQ
jgi:hypothetical protein